MNIAPSTQTTLCCPKHYGAVSGGEATHFKKKGFKKGFFKKTVKFYETAVTYKNSFA
jgi:hypothetical protein